MPNTEQGIMKDRYMVIPRTLIFIRCGDSILLLKGAANKRLWANKYNGIGGHVEHGEDIQKSAERELFEETGLSAEISLRGIVTVDAGYDAGIVIFVFYGEHCCSDLIPSLEGSLEWVKIKDFGSLPLMEDVQLFVEKILKMRAGDLPFIAHSTYNFENKLVVNFVD